MSNKGLIINKEQLDLILSGEKTIQLIPRITSVTGRVFLIDSESNEIRGSCIIDECVEFYTLQLFEDRKQWHLMHSGFWGKYKYGLLIRNGSVKVNKKPISCRRPVGDAVWVNLDDMGDC